MCGFRFFYFLAGFLSVSVFGFGYGFFVLFCFVWVFLLVDFFGTFLLFLVF